MEFDSLSSNTTLVFFSLSTSTLINCFYFLCSILPSSYFFLLFPRFIITFNPHFSSFIFFYFIFNATHICPSFLSSRFHLSFIPYPFAIFLSSHHFSPIFPFIPAFPSSLLRLQPSPPHPSSASLIPSPFPHTLSFLHPLLITRSPCFSPFLLFFFPLFTLIARPPCFSSSFLSFFPPLISLLVCFAFFFTFYLDVFPPFIYFLVHFASLFSPFTFNFLPSFILLSFFAPLIHFVVSFASSSLYLPLSLFPFHSFLL